MMISRLAQYRWFQQAIASLCLSVITITVVWSNVIAQEPEAADGIEFSEAETRLWLTDQLKSVSHAMELTYHFEKSGSLETGFSDRVRFVIQKINDDGTKVASVEFLTGERNFPVSPVDRATVNPLIKVYLQGDVYEMNRLTDPDGGSRERWRYFQRRIKFALAESATVKPKTFTFDGREWQGFEISFRPYINDPKRELFEHFANKSYSFIVCDELPGYLYRIETEVPAEDSAQPLLREVLQLTGFRPLG
ncbi:MAG: hypothetical protein O7B81_07665 [Gammaproteobacteria bacterium]|nr:hypothetical protein [Gammaproteobacteria bacterium]